MIHFFMRGLRLILYFSLTFTSLTLCATESSSGAIYFAAKSPPKENIPLESPLCFKFIVKDVDARLEEQLKRLKTKYPNLREYKLNIHSDGSRSLEARALEPNGDFFDYFYTSNPKVCNDYQLNKRHDKKSYSSSSSPQGSGLPKRKDNNLEIKLGNFIAIGEEVYYIKEIKAGDYDLLVKIKAKMEANGTKIKQVVFVNNFGGILDDALKIGKFIRTNRINTAAAVKCASACIYSFAGGVSRISYMDTQFGLHQIRFMNGYQGNVALGQQITGELFEYLEKMGVNPKVVMWQTQVDAKDIRWISQYEANGLKLVTEIKDNYESDIPNLSKIAEADTRDDGNTHLTASDKQLEEFITFMRYLFKQ